jgi:hypothetical protein
MKLAIMQPYFFPYIGYFQLISAVDKFIIYDDVNFINRGWINRNNILINGKASLINIQLIGASQNKLIKDILVAPDNKWKNTLLKTIEHNYRKAPYFNNVYGIVKQTLQCDAMNISQLNYRAISFICDYLNIETLLISSSAAYNNSELKGQHRIIDICKKENANAYYNPIGGKDLYDENYFRNEGISLKFLQATNVEYIQHNNSCHFIPNLSIIDILMNNSSDVIQNYLKSYRLV